MQEAIALPSTITVQALHSPTPHLLVPTSEGLHAGGQSNGGVVMSDVTSSVEIKGNGNLIKLTHQNTSNLSRGRAHQQ